MAYHESLDITDIDEDLLNTFRKHPKNISMVYVKRDKYTPRYIIENICHAAPLVRVVVLPEEEIEHAFVLKHSENVAEYVYKIYQHNTNN